MHEIIFSSTLVTVKEKNKKTISNYLMMFDEKYIIQTIPLKIIILALNLIFIYTIKFMKKNLYLMKYKILFLLEAWYWFINYFISNHIT